MRLLPSSFFIQTSEKNHQWIRVSGQAALAAREGGFTGMLAGQGYCWGGRYFRPPTGQWQPGREKLEPKLGEKIIHLVLVLPVGAGLGVSH